MKTSTILGAIGLAAITSAAPARAESAKTGILVASFDEFVHSVNLNNVSGKYTLSEVNKTTGCGGNPTWLDLDYAKHQLWCLDEGWNTINGSLNTFDVEDGLQLRPFQSRNVSAGPVHLASFGERTRIAVAQFGGAPTSGISGGITLHSLSPNGSFYGSHMINHTFETLPKPGPQKGQEVARGHGVVLDPTGHNLVVTDYGADKIRVFPIIRDVFGTGVEMETPPGSAPRHATFYTSLDNSTTYLFVLAENANTITTYNVSYQPQGEIHLSPPSHVIDTFGGNATAAVKSTAKAGEIQISPDKKFVIVSNRLDAFTPTSDSLSSFAINADGSLNFIQRVAVGGTSPRHFTLNKAGDKVLVSLTANSSIAVFERNVASGMICETPLARLFINTTAPGTTENAGIPAAIFYE